MNKLIIVSFKKRNKEDNEKEIKSVPKPSLGFCLAKIFFYKFVVIISIKTVHDVLGFSKPIILE